MGRWKRPHLPGAAHHIVARTPEDRFAEPIRRQIAQHLIEAAFSRDCRVLAHAIMPNHFHMLLYQGHYPLGEVMQPAMRRIALLLQNYFGFKGHAFERRFRSRVCANQAHLQNTVLYIHRNPLKEGLCTDSADYPYCTHKNYIEGEAPDYIDVIGGLRIATNTDSGDAEELREIYLKTFKGYIGVDDDNDFAWTHTRARQSRTSLTPTSRTTSQLLLRDVADVSEQLLKQIAPNIATKLVRSSFRGRSVSAARNQLIAALTQRGYRNNAISTYLNTSPQVVSRIRTAMRYGDLMLESDKKEIGKPVR